MIPSSSPILFYTSHWPHDRPFGAQLRTLHTVRALQKIGPISLGVVNGDIPDPEVKARSEAEFGPIHHVIPQVPSRADVGAKLSRAFNPRNLTINGPTASDSDCQQVGDKLADCELIWFYNVRVPNILGRWHWPKSHLDIDDVPSSYLTMLARNAKTFAERFKMRFQHHCAKRRESLLRERFTTLSVSSRADWTHMGGGKHLHVIPNGFECPDQRSGRVAPPHGPPRLGFIGLLSYEPNREGVVWFLNECWPIIRRAVPDARFRLIGKGSESLTGQTPDGVDVLGFVDDPADEMATWSTLVIPLRAGGGTRIKIAEAFSRRCPVISTHAGAYGYEVEHDRELLLADSSKEFAAACIQLLRHPEKGLVLADAAWEKFLVNWTWESISEKVRTAAKDCLSSGRNQESVPNGRDVPARHGCAPSSAGNA